MTTYGDGAANTSNTSNTVKTRLRKTGQPVTHRAEAWQKAKAEQHSSRARGLEAGWTIFSYMIAGMVSYGAIGWGIGKAVHIGLLFPLGMVAGLAISVGFVIYRYGRQGSMESKGMTGDR
jgi:F0F1-type ATP synthase assembly protein I